MFSLLSGMGNNQSQSTSSRSDWCRNKDKKPVVQVHSSEEDYLPMSLSMKKALIDGRRLQHVVPSKIAVSEPKRCKGSEGNGNDNTSSFELAVTEEKTVDGTTEDTESIVTEEEEKDSRNEVDKVISTPNYHGVLFTPVVTTVPMTAVSSKAMSLGESSSIHKCASRHTPVQSRSPTLTNRRFSLIEMKTGLTKSHFTLALEDRLRQSKLDLGLVSSMHKWREFTFKRTENKSDTQTLAKSNSKTNDEEIVNKKELKDSCPKEPTQYCAQSCQVSSPCRVRKPEVFSDYQNVQPSIFKEEINQKNEVRSLLKGQVRHPDKDNCDCDLCTLAYLTDMGFPEPKERNEETRGPTITITGGGSNEKITIIESDRNYKSIDISVSRRYSPATSLQRSKQNSSQSNLSTSDSTGGDCTNKKIWRMFKANNRQSVLNEIYNNENVGEDVSQTGPLMPNEDRPRSVHDCTKRAVEVRPADSELSQNNESFKSCSTVTASVSSSLSTILSYRRVRHMFQTIIEKNRSRRRTRKNIYKFKEMEELGLGQVKNNRWYPSDKKTVTIWNNMHSKVQGVQAEFKKYPKSHVKS